MFIFEFLKTPLEAAIDRKDYTEAKKLLENGADPCASFYKEKPLFLKVFDLYNEGNDHKRISLFFDYRAVWVKKINDQMVDEFFTTFSNFNSVSNDEKKYMHKVLNAYIADFIYHLKGPNADIFKLKMIKGLLNYGVYPHILSEYCSCVFHQSALLNEELVDLFIDNFKKNIHYQHDGLLNTCLNDLLKEYGKISGQHQGMLRAIKKLFEAGAKTGRIYKSSIDSHINFLFALNDLTGVEFLDKLKPSEKIIVQDRIKARIAYQTDLLPCLLSHAATDRARALIRKTLTTQMWQLTLAAYANNYNENNALNLGAKAAKKISASIELNDQVKAIFGYRLRCYLFSDSSVSTLLSWSANPAEEFYEKYLKVLLKELILHCLMTKVDLDKIISECLNEQLSVNDLRTVKEVIIEKNSRSHVQEKLMSEFNEDMQSVFTKVFHSTTQVIEQPDFDDGFEDPENGIQLLTMKG